MYPATPDGAEPPTRDDLASDPAATDNGTAVPAGTRYDPSEPSATNPAAPALAGALPRVFGEYDLLSEVARGGMGVVFKARHRRTDRIVALKMALHADLASAESLARFRIDARAAASLEHPGIVPVYDVGEADGRQYYTMPFFTSGSLHQALANGPLQPKAAAGVLRKVAEAVQYAHTNGIIHRDLKPANILLQADGSPGSGRVAPSGGEDSPLAGLTPRLADFGLARAATGEGLTATGEYLGTPGYMAPEQAAGAAAVGPLSDVYGLGAVLYCLLTGRPPFQAATVYETLRQVREEEPAPPRRLNPAVPPDLETVCLKCLEKDPARRYARAGALAEDLQRFRDGKPVVARPVGVPGRGWRWARRNPLTVALLAAIVASLLLGIVVSASYAIKANESARQARAALREKEEAVHRERNVAYRFLRYLKATPRLLSLPNDTVVARFLDENRDISRTELRDAFAKAPPSGGDIPTTALPNMIGD
jgi:serine/threonine protein kinase